MALDTVLLEDDLLSLFGGPPVAFDGGGNVDYDESRDQCAQQWAEAMTHYAVAISPTSTSVLAAQLVLYEALKEAFALGAAAATIDAAFQLWAFAVGAGMAPAFVATIPPEPVGFVTKLGTPQPTHEAAASYWMGEIDAWARTGTATPSGGGPPVPWS